MPQPSTPEQPLPVRTVARLISDWVGRLGRVWVEGQITEVSRRAGAATVFLVLRDPVADVSLRVTAPRPVVDAVLPPLAEGARVVVHGKPEFWMARGSLSLAATDVRPVGTGDLLARIERLKGILAAEGLLAAERKRPLPFLPRVVGLITGRGGAAQHDVVENAQRRWPAVRFAVREVPVQGHAAVTGVLGALRELERDPAVDVIVIARGGGSVEDLLPFSDESLCRAVAACRTPVVSAVGHEQDTPLLDLVADWRASTPTDAGKRVVPDVAEELTRVTGARDRLRRALGSRLTREQQAVAALRSRPVLAEPGRDLERRAGEVAALRDRARRCVAAALERGGDELTHTSARVRALSPAATLERGYAVVQGPNSLVVRSPEDAPAGTPLLVRLAGGRIGATSAGGASPGHADRQRPPGGRAVQTIETPPSGRKPKAR